MGSGILFDFGGTLDADGLPSVDQFFAHYRALGGRLGGETFGLVFQASDRALDAGLISPRDGFLAMVEKQVGVLTEILPDGQRLDRVEWAHRVHRDTLAAARRNHRVLDELSERFTLGVVSNFFGNLRAVLEELELLGFFHCITDSAIVGIRKPDPRAFQLTAAGMGLPAQECLMVGDNPYADIQGAGAVAMDTCWLAPPDRAVPAGVQPTHRIARLDQLPEMLP